MITLTKLRIKMWIGKIKSQRKNRKAAFMLIKAVEMASSLSAYESALWKIISTVQLHKKPEDNKYFTFQYPESGKEVVCFAVVKPVVDKPEGVENEKNN